MGEHDLKKYAHYMGIFCGIGLVAAAIGSLFPPNAGRCALTGSIGSVVLFIEALAPCCWDSGKNTLAEQRTCTQKFIMATNGTYSRFFLHGILSTLGIIITAATSIGDWYVWASMIALAACALLYLFSACFGKKETPALPK